MKTISSSLKAILALAILLSVSFVATVKAAEIVTTPDASHNAAAGGNGQSTTPIITPDGRFVLFMSAADDLVAGTSNAPLAVLFPPPLNVFLRDRSNAVTTLVSVNLSGSGGGNGDSIPAGISTNGRYALFESSASDLIAGDTNGASDVFVRDFIAGTTTLVSAGTNGLPGNGASRSAVMTPDGRFVAFVSAATNLVAGDNNGIPDVFVRDVLAGTTTLASVGAKSSPSSLSTYFNTPVSSEAPEITPDGRYVAFYSTATNLVPGVMNIGDIYVRDLVAGGTTWASTAARTTLKSVQNTSNAVSFSHVISADGKFVAFETSQAVSSPKPTNGIVLRYNLDNGFTDLVNTNAAVPFGATEDFRTLALTPDGRFVAFVANANDTSGNTACIEVWDASSGASTLASGGPDGSVQSNSLCAWPAITPDGRFVAFLSNATNLVTNALSGQFHVYVRDLQSATTTLVDTDTNGVGSGVTALTLPRLSDDGGFVAFEAWDGALVPDDSNKAYDVFVRDLIGATTELVSCHDPALASATPDGPSTLSQLSVSADGRYVAFASEADDLVPNDTNGCRDVFVRDLVAGTNILVSADLSGITPGNGVSSEPAISADGRYVAFSSSATNLVASDTNNAQDVFVRDLQTGTTTLVSVSTDGINSGNGNSFSPTISTNGRYVLFHSKASNLAAGSFGNAIDNLFWRDLSLNVTYAVTFYTSGYSGTLSINSDLALAHPTYASWVEDVMTWSLPPPDTCFNLAGIIQAPFYNYVGSVTAYKCPADNYLSPLQRAAGYTARPRSYSMNGFFGASTPTWSNTRNEFFPAYRQFLKMSAVPNPSNLYVILGEHPDNINDGYFKDSANTNITSSVDWPGGVWGDVPASDHNGADGFGFADGHAEIHLWKSFKCTILPVTYSPVPHSSLLSDPAGKADASWLASHSSVPY